MINHRINITIILQVSISQVSFFLFLFFLCLFNLIPFFFLFIYIFTLQKKKKIWDLRTFKLVRTCQPLDQTHFNFNSKGDVIFSVHQTFDERRRNRSNPFGTSFRTFDSFNYR